MYLLCISRGCPIWLGKSDIFCFCAVQKGMHEVLRYILQPLRSTTLLESSQKSVTFSMFLIIPTYPASITPHFVHLTQKYIELTKLQVVRVVVRGLSS
jgi:hypothetical protein